MIGLFRWCNPALALIGRRIVPDTIGHWYVTQSGKLDCTRRQSGWYLAGPGEWESLPDDATALQRFAMRHRSEIAARARELRAEHDLR